MKKVFVGKHVRLEQEKINQAYADECIFGSLIHDLVNVRQSTLGDLKRYWKVSKAALIRRAYDLTLINKNKYTNMMIELSRSAERRTEREDIGLHSSPAFINYNQDLP